MASEQKRMENEKLSMVLPPAIARAWIKGEYGTSESTGYEFIGWSLLLRGMYIYEVETEKDDKKVLSHWGICTIDIQDGDLTYQGLRIYSNPELIETQKDKNEAKRKRGKNLRFWRSEFSKISRRTGDGEPHVYFGYVMYNDEVETGQVTFPAESLCKSEFDDYVGSADVDLQYPPTKKYLETRKEKSSSSDSDLNKKATSFIGRAQHYLYEGLQNHLDEVETQKQDQIVSIIHIDLERWSENEWGEREGDYQIVESKERYGAHSGKIIWTPLSQTLRYLESISSQNM